MEEDRQPVKFLTIRVHNMEEPVGYTGLCAGYEDNEWRATQLADHLIEWLPEFALRYSERNDLRAENAVRLLVQAAKTVYTTTKYEKRGEVGELLLHVAMRQVFNTIPAISKYYFKDSQNDTVKGFDAVHVIATENSLQLWLGEVKFYTDLAPAVRDAVKELEIHTKHHYLRSEFLAITNKIDPMWPYADRLKKLIDKNTSLDEIFDKLCIPIFLSYESSTISSHTSVSIEFQKALADEIVANYKYFCEKALPSELTIHLFLFPMKAKEALIKAFDEKLRKWQ
jgi:hypothetical protein